MACYIAAPAFLPSDLSQYNTLCSFFSSQQPDPVWPFLLFMLLLPAAWPGPLCHCSCFSSQPSGLLHCCLYCPSQHPSLAQLAVSHASPSCGLALSSLSHCCLSISSQQAGVATLTSAHLLLPVICENIFLFKAPGKHQSMN